MKPSLPEGFFYCFLPACTYGIRSIRHLRGTTVIMKLFFTGCLTTGLLSVLLYLPVADGASSFNASKPVIRSVTTEEKLKTIAAEAKAYVRVRNLNTDFCMLLDMSLPSGKKRFFIWDLKKDSLLSAGLVTHGNCYQDWLEGRKYSNVEGSGCTSLGRYKTGIAYTGQWGYAWKLHGLDSSNSNAYVRAVVLHSHACVPEDETEAEICQSNGCPTVSPGMLTQLKKRITGSAKPVLLQIYE